MLFKISCFWFRLGKNANYFIIQHHKSASPLWISRQPLNCHQLSPHEKSKSSTAHFRVRQTYCESYRSRFRQRVDERQRDVNGGYLWIKMSDRTNEPRVTGGYQVNWKLLDGGNSCKSRVVKYIGSIHVFSWLIFYGSLYEYKRTFSAAVEQQVQALSRVLRTQPDPAPYSLTKARHTNAPNSSVLWKDKFKESEADVQPCQTEQSLNNV